MKIQEFKNNKTYRCQVCDEIIKGKYVIFYTERKDVRICLKHFKKNEIEGYLMLKGI